MSWRFLLTEPSACRCHSIRADTRRARQKREATHLDEPLAGGLAVQEGELEGDGVNGSLGRRLW